MGVGFSKEYLLGLIPYILAIGFFLFLFWGEEIGAYVSASMKPETNGGGWFYQYQTLIAGLIAVLGALLTILTMRKTHQDIVFSNNLKARAYMHDTARELCDYCDELFLMGCKNIDSEDEKKAIDLKMVGSPQNSVNNLKDHIGFLDKKSAKAISALLSQYQVFHSRSKSKHKNEYKKLASQLVEIAEFNIRALRIFDYARAVEKNDFEKNYVHVPISTEKIYQEDIEEQLRRFERDIYGYGVAVSYRIFNDPQVQYFLKTNYKSRL